MLCTSTNKSPTVLPFANGAKVLGKDLSVEAERDHLDVPQNQKVLNIGGSEACQRYLIEHMLATKHYKTRVDHL